ncbi:hypothetical protein CRE_18850 [Caenorhabditis remanei]|uniref:Uncharacterized protein n=1 Tax=Caenorhabditis remanei TaxID=31234 RepID=E3LL01_CAERE|nr:hypothetical protein CRE_18850 [Caenorhabditis remanei]
MLSKSPSILENGQGLFGTHVTLEDINSSIREHMNTESQLTSDSQMDVIGDGNGFSSRVILITCNWSIPSESLPKKIVLKIVSFVHIRQLVEKAKNEGYFKISEEDEEKMSEEFEKSIQLMHNQEIRFYETLKSANTDSQRFLTPKVFFYQKFDDNNSTKGFIGMEFIERSDIRHTYEVCTPEEIQPVLRAIASIQALSFTIPEEDFKRIEDGSVYIQTMHGMMAEEGMKGIFEHTKRTDPERFAERITRIQSHGSNLLNLEKAFDLNKFLGIPRNVLVHGDLWSANILWRSGENNVFSACKILDYQMAHTGNPAEDLVRLLSSTLSGSIRQSQWENILEQFYGYFVEALGKSQKEIPYTLEQLKQSYRLFFPMGGLALLPLFGPAIDMKMKSMEKEKAAEHRQVVVEKLECLLDDVEKFYLESI